MSAIDPGVDEAIGQGADDIESDRSDDELEASNEEDFFQPSRWWFASTACPLLAGTFGPMASGFNIVALCTYWREVLPLASSKEPSRQIEDPAWLVSINALSLLAALVANAALLLNMARRAKFSVAQPTIIIGFGLAGALLFADIAALTSSSDYRITQPQFQPGPRHALTSAFYFAVFAAGLYLAISALMCLTVYGALKGHYEKQFQLTSSQRALMLQTMAFMAYLLLGALVFNTIEQWGYSNSVYWANVTLLTIGLGDFSPATSLGRGLLFPFVIGGVLTVGLVVGSIRSLILERGKQKMSARIMNKRRKNAINSVDAHKETVKISMFASATLSVDPELYPAQRREEEFNVMRKVQSIAADERRYLALSTSLAFALMLWFVGAAAFQQMEYLLEWTYLEALYFSFVSLMTIGYGDLTPKSNAGRAFYVFWTLLAVPSLTILISNMGDTIVKWVSELTNWIGQLTVLPSEDGLRATIKKEGRHLAEGIHNIFKNFTSPGVFNTRPIEHAKRMNGSEFQQQMEDRIAKRLVAYVTKAELQQHSEKHSQADALEMDIRFYHYVLARECRNLQKALDASPPKAYAWAEWEYFLKLMGDEREGEDFPGQSHPDIMVPDAMQSPKEMSSDALTSIDSNIDRQTSAKEGLEARRREHKRRTRKNSKIEPRFQHDWSWLSNESPLMSNKSEAAWILDRLSAAMERELDRQRKGYKRAPPIGISDAVKSHKVTRD